jgi:hypothetical protein
MKRKEGPRHGEEYTEFSATSRNRIGEKQKETIVTISLVARMSGQKKQNYSCATSNQLDSLVVEPTEIPDGS